MEALLKRAPAGARRLATGLMILALACGAVVRAARAAEVDQFTDRAADVARPDVSGKVSALIDDGIDEAIKAYAAGQARQGAPAHCDRDLLWKYLELALDTNFPNPTKAIHGKSQAEIPRGTLTHVSGTIYDVGYLTQVTTGPLMHVHGCCAPVVNLGGHIVGTDKISHLLGHGFPFYEEVRKAGGDVEAGLKWGLSQENSVWGLIGTGVKSYGDMAANYGGYFFWRDLLDVPEPYIACQADGTYKRVRNVDILRYVDDAWDEAYNCSSYVNHSLASQVEENIRKVSGGMNCPLSIGKCLEIAKNPKYPPSIAKYLISPYCRDPYSYHPPIEHPPDRPLRDSPWFDGIADWYRSKKTQRSVQ